MNKKYEELNPQNIDNEITEIKKILDHSNMQTKNLDTNQKDSLIDSDENN